MAHEKSMTFKRSDGKWVNVPSVVDGKTLPAAEVERRMNAGLLRPLGAKTFKSSAEAVTWTKARSKRTPPSEARRRGLARKAPSLKKKK